MSYFCPHLLPCECVYRAVAYQWVYTSQYFSKYSFSFTEHTYYAQLLCFWTLSIVLSLSKKHRPVYFSKHNVSETGFCLRLQVKPTQLGPIDRASPYLQIMSINIIVVLMYHRHKLLDLIYTHYATEEINRLILFREIVSLYSENHIRQNVKLSLWLTN
jgi:hypothetical protein